MNLNLIYRYTLIAALLAGGFAFADEKSEERITPGCRSASYAEWVKMQKEREDKEEQAKADEALLSEEKAVEGTLNLTEKAKASASGVTYFSSHAGAYHNPMAVSFLGDFVTLEDGSGWIVSPSDSYMTLNWLTSDLIVITSNSDWFSSYLFRMTNLNTGVTIRCNLVEAPFYNGVYTHWIVAINYFTQEICLEDGSIWKISGFDTSIFNDWMLNDTIVIGVNDKFLSSSRPNILINVNTMTFVRANCTY